MFVFVYGILWNDGYDVMMDFLFDLKTNKMFLLCENTENL